MKDNKYGVLLAVSSLPGKHGIGDFGFSAYEFIDFLAARGYKYWQILPLNPIGPGNSPYMSTCSEAIDYRYINLDELVSLGLISSCDELVKETNSVNYYEVGEVKLEKLKEAYANFQIDEEYNRFLQNNKWIKPYSLYTVLMKNFNVCWNKCDNKWKLYFDNHSIDELPSEYQKDCEFHIFCQFIAHKQWKKVREYAKQKGIKLIADCPFYVGIDSVECWMNKDKFLMDENYNPTLVSGCPPDAFSDDGQLWGTPVYDFKKLKEDNYSFLINRISYLASNCDFLRLDHFRAWDTYCVIPANDDNARRGEWWIGPRDEFFDILFEEYPDINIIAEDLGELFDTVHELRDYYNLPGMYVTQFMIHDPKLISNDNQIVYTGTHDNPTLVGWVNSLKEEEKQNLFGRFGEDKDLVDAIFEFTWNSDSFLTIIPLQDLLKLDNTARMNMPGTTGSPNWEWKLKDNSYKDNIKLGL